MYRDGSTLVDEHDDAVSAILIGESLVDQIAQTATELRAPHAAERWRKLRDVQDEYPEVWRQLDRARTELARRGVNTAAYEELRPSAPTAVVHDGSVIDGVALDEARRAIAELKLAVPGADWPEIESRTSRLVGAPELRRRSWSGIAVVLTLLAAAIATWAIAAMPERKTDERVLMRRELAGVVRERKATLLYLEQANIIGRCDAELGKAYAKQLVLDDRGMKASDFYNEYLVRCGENEDIEKWANAPLPPLPR